MRGIAVDKKGLHAKVHLHKKQGESVQSFTAGLRAEASICGFHVDVQS